MLITSRERSWAEIAAPVEIDVLARAESVAILQDRVAGLDRRPTPTGSLRSLATCHWPSPKPPGSWPKLACPPPEYLELLQTRAGQILDQGSAGVLSAVAGGRDPAHRRPARPRGPGRCRAGQLVRVPGPRAHPRRPVHPRRRQNCLQTGGPGC